MHLLDLLTFNRGIYFGHNPYWILKGTGVLARSQELQGIGDCFLYCVYKSNISVPAYILCSFTFEADIPKLSSPFHERSDEGWAQIFYLDFTLVCNIWRLTDLDTAQALACAQQEWAKANRDVLPFPFNLYRMITVLLTNVPLPSHLLVFFFKLVTDGTVGLNS